MFLDFRFSYYEMYPQLSSTHLILATVLHFQKTKQLYVAGYRSSYETVYKKHKEKLEK